jgi:hypothetical protein
MVQPEVLSFSSETLSVSFLAVLNRLYVCTWYRNKHYSCQVKPKRRLCLEAIYLTRFSQITVCCLIVSLRRCSYTCDMTLQPVKCVELIDICVIKQSCKGYIREC